MLDIYIIHNNPNIKDIICNSEINSDAFYHFLDEGSLKEKSKAYKFKSEWCARQTPFIGIYKDGKMFKGFYSETGEDVIQSLIKYLNHEYKSN